MAELLGITGELQKTLAIFSKRCRRVGMADEADSKSVVGNHVRVQVPLPAVNLIPKVLEFCSGLLGFFVKISI